MQKVVFEVVSPLQILLALEMVNLLSRDAEVHVIVLGGFSGAEAVADTLPGLMHGASSINFHNTFSDAMGFISQLRPNKIFTHADVGVKKGLQLLRLKVLNPRMVIAVYEEGLGTYRDDLYHGVKRKIFPKVGIGIYFGGSVLTSEVHVLLPDLYRSIFSYNNAHIVQIPLPPLEVIKRRRLEIFALFGHKEIERSGDHCSIYLSNWSADQNLVAQLSMRTEDVYFKPHPRLQQPIDNPAIIHLPAGVPAEIILADLSQKYKSITVYHHGSSTEWYCGGDRMEFVQV